MAHAKPSKLTAKKAWNMATNFTTLETGVIKVWLIKLTCLTIIRANIIYITRISKVDAFKTIKKAIEFKKLKLLDISINFM